MRILPFGQEHGSRFGECRLCADFGQQSKTHVPPKGAGNSQPARRAVQYDAGSVSSYSLGRPRDGGMWDYWFCPSCNSRTGVWDEEFIRVQRRLLRYLHAGPELPRQRLMGPLPQVDVGAFARAMWAWSFALVPSLAGRYPEVAAAVRTGGAAEPPEDVELLLGVTMSLRMWACAQPGGWLVRTSRAGAHRRRSGLLVPGPELEPLPVTVVACPPFSVVLAHRDHPGAVPHSRVSDWLLDPAGTRRELSIDLPMVEVAREGMGAPPTYASFRPAGTLPS